MFLKSPRKWVSPQYTSDEIEKFHSLVKEHNYNPLTDILPHGQYFINLANPDKEKAEQSYASFLDELKRCESLGVGHYNFHPGSALKGDKHQALLQLASYINKAIAETEFVKIVIENMAGTGNLVGSTFEDIATVIEHVENKDRVGVCIDTCHSFAAGLDLHDEETYTKFWSGFDSVIGAKYLKGIHLNDSKAPLGANRDLHQKLGQGFLGLECFRLMANDERLKSVPIILETPFEDESEFGDEIKLMEWLQGREKDDAEYVAKSQELSGLGEAERKEHLKKFEKKTAAKAAPKRAAKGKDILSRMTKKAKKEE